MKNPSVSRNDRNFLDCFPEAAKGTAASSEASRGKIASDRRGRGVSVVIDQQPKAMLASQCIGIPNSSARPSRNRSFLFEPEMPALVHRDEQFVRPGPG